MFVCCFVLDFPNHNEHKSGGKNKQPQASPSKTRAATATPSKVAIKTEPGAKAKSGPGRPPRDIDTIARTTLLGFSEADVLTARR